jgi:tRNA A-37 threonylcarbamoyl transferase component Bud32/tetratricopeptide (TPR) repeat protein
MIDASAERPAANDTVDVAFDGDREPFERVAEEFVERCRRGESPSVAEYLERYPEHAETIRKLLPAVAMIERLGRGAASPSAEQQPPRATPSQLGDFRIVRELGRGGMGVVYEAVQESLGRKVALKVIHQVQLDARRLERFHREAQAIARLHHTNIVPIFAVGEHDGLPYYAMQYIRGRGLDAVVDEWRRGKTPVDGERRWFVARIGIQAAEALQYAHEQGILHRDVKPANLLVDEQQSVWITDFGLAKLTGQDDLTRSGDVIGTLRYLAPEALGGRTGPENDIYSLGLTLYELITLNSPFGDVSASELLRRVSESQPTRPRKLDPSIPRDLETIVLKAIAPEPGDRYPTALELAGDLRCFVEDRPIRARRATVFERMIRWSRRNRAMAGLAATAASALVFAAIVGWVGYASTRQALLRSDQNVELSLAVFGELFDRLSPDEDFFPPPTGRRVHRPRPAGPIERRRPPGGEGELGPSFEGGERVDGRAREGPGRRLPRGALAERFGPGRKPVAPLVPGGNPFVGDRPMAGEGSGPHGAGDAEEPTALLSSVLNFYERFAERNQTNSRLQAEAARAYFKVGSLLERLDRIEEAERALERAFEMFEELVGRFPSVVEYRSKIVGIAIMTDPWSVDPSSLLPLERRLRRARELVDQLAAGNPQDLEYVQSQIHVYAKLGAVMQRLDRPGDAESAYRRAIEFAGSLMERSSSPARATIDRADVREALALLGLECGRSDVARGLLEGAIGDLRSLQGSRNVWPMLTERFASLAEGFRKLGDFERAEMVAGWARTGGGRAARKASNGIVEPGKAR